MRNQCAICDSPTTFFTRRKIANEQVICEECFKKAKNLTNKQLMKLKNVTAEEIGDSIESSVGKGLLNFKSTYRIGSKVELDEINKKILIRLPFGSHRILNHEDIEGFELLEDGTTVKSGGIGRAVVGGLLFGGAGAVVGAVTAKEKSVCSSLQIKLELSKNHEPKLFVDFINEKVKTDSSTYKTARREAEDFLAILERICNR